jgi:hypothetical protein
MADDPDFDWTRVDFNDAAFVPNNPKAFEKICKPVTEDLATAGKNLQFAKEVSVKRYQNDYQLRVKQWGYEHDLEMHHVGNDPVKQGPLFAKIKEVSKNRKKMVDDLTKVRKHLEMREITYHKARWCQDHGWSKGKEMPKAATPQLTLDTVWSNKWNNEVWRQDSESIAHEAALWAAKDGVSTAIEDEGKALAAEQGH